MHEREWDQGRWNPEEYAAIKLDQKLSKIGTNGMHNFPFAFPNDRMYSEVFEHSRELRQLGLPVNVHRATLTLLPNMVRVTEVPSRVETRVRPLFRSLCRCTGPRRSEVMILSYSNLLVSFGTGGSCTPGH